VKKGCLVLKYLVQIEQREAIVIVKSFFRVRGLPFDLLEGNACEKPHGRIGQTNRRKPQQ
jgi:hypothetical protein